MNEEMTDVSKLDAQDEIRWVDGEYYRLRAVQFVTGKESSYYALVTETQSGEGYSIKDLDGRDIYHQPVKTLLVSAGTLVRVVKHAE